MYFVHLFESLKHIKGVAITTMPKKNIFFISWLINCVFISKKLACKSNYVKFIFDQNNVG